MVFFTTPELLEIGRHPLQHRQNAGSPRARKRSIYRRKVRDNYRLHIASTMGQDRHPSRTAIPDHCFRSYRRHPRLQNEKVIVSTGYYDLSNKLNIPGEDRQKYFTIIREPHPF